MRLLILRSDVYKTLVAIRIMIVIVKGTGGPLIALFDHKVECNNIIFPVLVLQLILVIYQ